MAVQITQNPGTYNLANGTNAVTLSNIGASELKYVLQVRNISGSTTLADIRQAPNAAGVALFDIQQILQSYVGPTPAGVETVLGWTTGATETLQYNIFYGSENASGDVTIDGSITARKVFSGRKEWDDITWSAQSAKRMTLTQNGGCTTVQNQGELLTDWNRIEAAVDLPGSVPAHILAYTNAQVYVQDIRREDDRSISFMQEPIKIGTVTANNIVGARLVSYDANDNLVDDVIIYNYTGLSGGPDVNPGDNDVVNYPYLGMSLACGPTNSEVGQELSPQATYYYITLHSFQLGSCAQPVTHTGVTEISSFIAYRFNIVSGDCNDFDPVQFSWQNSYGFRDYFTFVKRWDESYTSQRNEYLKNTFDWNGSTVSIDEGARGYTTFGNKISNTWVARTDWLTNLQSEYLKNLFLSADVRVKFPGSNIWDSVSIISSSYDVKTTRKDRMFQYEIRFKTANNLNSQRG